MPLGVGKKKRGFGFVSGPFGGCICKAWIVILETLGILGWTVFSRKIHFHSCALPCGHVAFRVGSCICRSLCSKKKVKRIH